MDIVASLHWLRENLPAFNGNPNMVTLMGHGHGAALANILIVSPVASGMYLLFLLDICSANGKLFSSSRSRTAFYETETATENGRTKM